MFIYFSYGVDSSYEPIEVFISVSTPIGESLVVDWVWKSYVVSFAGLEVWNVILCMEWLASYHVVLDFMLRL